LERGELNAFARFDLSALPALPPGSAIEKATLRLWVESVGAPGSVAVVPVLSPWTEAALAFGSAPPLGQSVTTSTRPRRGTSRSGSTGSATRAALPSACASG
jgi:hypothetical protein